jgi:hypothetical protein
VFGQTVSTAAGRPSRPAQQAITSPTHAVVIWDHSGQANQQWTMNAGGGITGTRGGRLPATN